MPPYHRTIIILSDIEGLSYREIAEVLGCPMGTVMSRLHNARRRLRTLLAPLLGFLLALWLAFGGLPSWAQAPPIFVTARILWASNAPPPGAPPPGGQGLVPGQRAPDEEFRPHLKHLREIFPHQTHEQLDTIRAQIPLGFARRFALPGGRELEMRPLAVRGAFVQMDIKILNRGAPELSVVPELSSGRPTMVGGLPYRGGVLIIAITAHPQ